jgi:hypothetical protein
LNGGGGARLRYGRQLEFCDGLDQGLVDSHKVRVLLVIDCDVSKADKETLFFVDRVGHAIPHRGDEKFANVGAIHSPDADANLLAFWHELSSPCSGEA